MLRLCAALAVALGAPAAAFPADVRIVTDPEGAEVVQGSISLGVTTREGLRVVGVEPGSVTFTISKQGFETVTKVVSVGSGSEPMTLLVRLRPLVAPGETESADTAGAPNPEPVPTPKPKGGSNTALIVLGGAALVGGGVALAAGHGSSPPPTTTTTTLQRTATLADLSAQVTSSQEGKLLNCNDLAFFTVSLTNKAPALVFITGVRLHGTSLTGGCTVGPDFSYPVTNAQVGTGTANVLTNRLLFSGGVGCCSDRSGCRGSCNFQFSFTVLTSVGEVPAGAVSFGVEFDRCPVCSSLAASGFTLCPARP